MAPNPEGDFDEDVDEFEVPADGQNEDMVADAVQAQAEEGTAAVVPAPKKKYGKACLPSEPGAATSNQTLIKWLPGKRTIEDLGAASNEDKIHELEDGAKVRVAYQIARAVTWNGTTETICGRTLEEDFGLENPGWTQADERKQLGLIVKGGAADPNALAEGLHKNVSRKSFDKTNFALSVLIEDEESWHVPAYIRDGLVWLKDEVRIELEVATPDVVPLVGVEAPGEPA